MSPRDVMAAVSERWRNRYPYVDLVVAPVVLDEGTSGVGERPSGECTHSWADPVMQHWRPSGDPGPQARTWPGTGRRAATQLSSPHRSRTRRAGCRRRSRPRLARPCWRTSGAGAASGREPTPGPRFADIAPGGCSADAEPGG